MPTVGVCDINSKSSQSATADMASTVYSQRQLLAVDRTRHQQCWQCYGLFGTRRCHG